jgi:hypothetical protein
MSTAGDGNLEQAVEAMLARINRHWWAIGVVEADRAALTADLRAELTAAAADGIPPQQLIGGDVRTFARDVADGARVRRARYEWGRLFAGALIGAIPGLIVSWFVVWRWWTVPLPTDSDSLTLTFAVRWGGCAAVFLAGVLYGAHQGLRDDAAASRTVSAMVAYLPIAGAIAVPVTMAFATLFDYSTSVPVVAAEGAIVGGLLATATAFARRWALRPILGPPPSAPSPQPLP